MLILILKGLLIRYAYDTFINSNQFSRAIGYMETAAHTYLGGYSCWGFYPTNYSVPTSTFIHF